MREQESLAVECCHAARTGGRHGLTVRRVFHVARGEYALDAGLRRRALDLDIALGIECELTLENVGVGVVSYGQEEARDVDRALLARGAVAESCSSPSTSAVFCSNRTSMLEVEKTRSCIAFEARR